MDEIANILTDIKKELSNIYELLSNSHPCRKCKALVSNGCIKCPNCDRTDP